jgi:hypothetical protein
MGRHRADRPSSGLSPSVEGQGFFNRYYIVLQQYTLDTNTRDTLGQGLLNRGVRGNATAPLLQGLLNRYYIVMPTAL